MNPLHTFFLIGLISGSVLSAMWYGIYRLYRSVTRRMIVGISPTANELEVRHLRPEKGRVKWKAKGRNATQSIPLKGSYQKAGPYGPAWVVDTDRGKPLDIRAEDLPEPQEGDDAEKVSQVMIERMTGRELNRIAEDEVVELFVGGHQGYLKQIQALGTIAVALLAVVIGLQAWGVMA